LRSWTSSLTTFLDELSNQLAYRTCREVEAAGASAAAAASAAALSGSGMPRDIDITEAKAADAKDVLPPLPPDVRRAAAQIVTRLAASAQYSKVSLGFLG